VLRLPWAAGITQTEALSVSALTTELSLIHAGSVTRFGIAPGIDITVVFDITVGVTVDVGVTVAVATVVVAPCRTPSHAQ